MRLTMKTTNTGPTQCLLYSIQCVGCTTAPLPKYANNEIFQELPKEQNYFTNTDEKHEKKQGLQRRT